MSRAHVPDPTDSTDSTTNSTTATGRAEAGRLLLAALVIALGLGLDQASKWWAFEHLRGQPPVVLIDEVLTFEFAFNPGSAFGMFAGDPRARLVFIAITLVSLVYIGALLRRLPGAPRSRRARLSGTVALALMAAGALGNLIDRLVRVHDVRMRLGDELPFWLLVEHPTRLAETLSRGRNFVDVPRHGVIDFIVVDYGGARPWPAFNVADSCLVVGVGLLVIFVLAQGGLSTPESPDST